MKLGKFPTALLIILLFHGATSAQMITETPPLTVGDKCPDLVFEKMVNYSKGNHAKLSDFGKKLIILDFWATWCIPCVRNFPKMAHLQKKYAKDLQFIGINTEKGQKLVADFYKKSGQINFPTLLTTTDSYIHQIFPHKYLPHYVWIDKNRIIRGITEDAPLTEKNIKAIIDGKAVELDYKNDSLIQDGRMGDTTTYKSIDSSENRLIISSTLKKYDPTRSFYWEVATNNHIKAVNMPVRNLFLTAFQGPHIKNNDWRKLILEVENPESFEVQPEDRSQASQLRWRQKNFFCYELKLQPIYADSIYLFKKMQEELMNYFGVNARIEKRKVSCLVLEGPGNDSLKTQHSESRMQIGSYFISLLSDKKLKRDFLLRFPASL